MEELKMFVTYNPVSREISLAVDLWSVSYERAVQTLTQMAADGRGLGMKVEEHEPGSSRVLKVSFKI